MSSKCFRVQKKTGHTGDLAMLLWTAEGSWHATHVPLKRYENDDDVCYVLVNRRGKHAFFV